MNESQLLGYRSGSPDLAVDPDSRTWDGFDWRELGERDWNLSVITGRTDDDEPEHEAAREAINQIREHLPDLTADQLRDYLWGLHDAMSSFFWHGL